MKVNFPSAKYFLKSLILAAVLGVIAYFIAPMLNLNNIGISSAFGFGMFSGALIGALLAATRITTAASTKTESIFVGNLAFKTPANALRDLFGQYGDVHAVRLMTDRVTHKPRGFGFVEMRRKDALAAIRALNGKEFYGRELKVNIANERKTSE